MQRGQHTEEIAGIDVEDALRYSVNGMDGVWENIGNYLLEAEAHRERMKVSLAQRDFSQYTNLAHALKSTSALLGDGKISEQALAQEQAGRTKEYELLCSRHPAFDRMLGEWNKLLAQQYAQHLESSQ